jgi:hypothetical protein
MFLNAMHQDFPYVQQTIFSNIYGFPLVSTKQHNAVFNFLVGVSYIVKK